LDFPASEEVEILSIRRS